MSSPPEPNKVESNSVKSDSTMDKSADTIPVMEVEPVSYEVRIPKSRIAVLIGTNGETKKKIEEETDTSLDIDSAEGEVIVSGEDVVTSYIVKDIVKAIGRGFNPEIALTLLKPDNAFELIEMHELAKHKNQLVRVKGRIIGKGGLTRDTIEKYMEVHVSVFGKTIGIIGEVERVNAAKQAVEMLLDGSPHANVYRWLEKKKKIFAREEMLGKDIEFKEGMDKYAE